MKFMPFRTKPLSIAIGLILLVALGVPTFAFAAPPSPLVPASESAQRISDLFIIVASIAIAIFVLVEALIVFAVVRFRRKSEDEMPVQVHGNNFLELLWTIVPAGIMVGLFVITIPVVNFQRETPTNDAMVVQVIGRQWQWEFEYPETGVTTVRELHLPTGRPIVLELSSLDVIHSFWVPQLGGKTDVIPGYNNTMWFTIDEPGVYEGQCAEFCGLEHYAMLFTITAMPPDEFATWMDGEVKALSTFTPVGTDLNVDLPLGDPAQGQELYASLGCSACHSLDGSQLIGPSFKGMASRAVTRKPGMAPDLYLHESIVSPCENVVSGFTCVMPQDFGTKKLNKQMLADIIAFLLEQ